MSEFENKIEYCDGVIATLENALQDFQKLKHKIKVENEYKFYFLYFIVIFIFIYILFYVFT